MRESHIEHVLIQIHTLPLKICSRLWSYFVNALQAFQIMSQEFFLVSQCGCPYIGWLFFHSKCVLCCLSLCWSAVSCALAACCCYTGKQGDLRPGHSEWKNPCIWASHELMFVPVANYPPDHEFMFSSKCSEKQVALVNITCQIEMSNLGPIM